MTEDRIWDPKKGWVKVKTPKRIVIRRKKPSLSLTEEYIEEYDNAPFNEDWDMTDATDVKQGYNFDTNPTTIMRAYHYKNKMFHRMNRVLELIPFVKVEVIE